MPYWRDELANQLNSHSSGSELVKPKDARPGQAFFPYHFDRRLAKLTWQEWLHYREAQCLLGRLPKMRVTVEYQPKPLVPLFEVDEDDNVLLKLDGRLVSAGR